MRSILVINPNSTEAITRSLDGALDGLRATDRPKIVCVTLAEGPPGIETDEDIREVEAPLVARVLAEGREAVAFVIACFSDPGLTAVRGATGKPVLGIARSGLMTALSLAPKIGVISIQQASVQRHRILYEELGVTDHVVGDRSVGMHVTELAKHPQAPSRLAREGQALISDGAGAIVLGCTGMTAYRARLEESLGVPVIDPTVAAVAMAMGLVAAG
jgi:Asp/Glu/hydantoin racemase